MHKSDFFKHCGWYTNRDLYEKLKLVPYNERRLHGSLINSLLLGDLNACKSKMADLKIRYGFHINQDLTVAGNCSCCRAIEVVYSSIFEQNTINYTNALKMFQFLVKEGAEINTDTASVCFKKLNFVSESIFKEQMQFLQLLLNSGVTCNKSVYDYFYKIKPETNIDLMKQATYFFLQNGFPSPSSRGDWNNGFDICSQWYLVMPLYCLEKKGVLLIL